MAQDDAYSHLALSAALDATELDARDRALATELVYGVLTWRRGLDKVLDNQVKHGIETLSAEILTVLRVALYQLWFLDRVPAHAAINEAVEATKGYDERAAGMVNAVLRQLSQADRVWWSEALTDTNSARYIGQRYSVSSWIARELVAVYGERASEVANAYTHRAPTWARADTAPDGLAEKLEAHDAVPGAWRVRDFDDAVRAALDAGTLSIQDLGSQLVGALCAPRGGERALDACAGLGSKSLHLLGKGAVEVVSVDPVWSKLEHLERAAAARGWSERVALRAGKLEEVAGDLGDFDLVLVDAPCSGLGTMRRHPETRWRRKADDVTELAAIQSSLLDVSAGLVRPGGVLVYSVCTFTRAEGAAQVEAFLERHPEFAREATEVEWLEAFTDGQGDLALDPARHGSDGFYAARMRKNLTV